MRVMYSMFKKSPTIDKIDTIIINLKNILYSKVPRYSGIREDTINVYYAKWITAESTSTCKNQQLIDDNFEEIIEHVNTIAQVSCTQLLLEAYLNIIEIYSKKIKAVYGLSSI
jgi:hypothetical protein